MNKKEILTEDDYYNYFKQFEIWLVKKKGKKLENLSSKKSKKYFSKFIFKWNNDLLKSIFYDKEQLLSKYGHLNKTNHTWNFKLTKEDSAKLNECISEVHQINGIPEINEKIIEKSNKIIGPSFPTSKKDTLPLKNQSEIILEKEQFKENQKKERKYLEKIEKREKAELEDKKIGREAIIEKKKAANKILNGPKDETGLEEIETFGDDSKDSFKKAKEIEKKFLDRKSEKIKRKEIIMNEKWKKYQADEDQKVKNLINNLGLNDRFKI